MKQCPDCCGSGQGTRSIEWVAGRAHVEHERCQTCGGHGEIDDHGQDRDVLLKACKAAMPVLAAACGGQLDDRVHILDRSRIAYQMLQAIKFVERQLN